MPANHRNHRPQGQEFDPQLLLFTCQSIAGRDTDPYDTPAPEMAATLSLGCPGIPYDHQRSS